MACTFLVYQAYVSSQLTKVLPPDLSLDGELWVGRNLFDYTSGICRSSRHDEWEHVKYMFLTQIFDTPSMPNASVEDRWALLAERFPIVHSNDTQSVHAPGVYMVGYEACTCQAHLDTILQRILALDGEGYVRLILTPRVMLRRPKSVYEYKRSKCLYKLKPTLDAEARVVAYEKGQNRITGLVGSLVCDTLSDPPRRFRVGSGLTDALRKHPPEIGSVISFQYGGISPGGQPRFSRYRGIVPDRG
ncbi:hypothetical protein MVES1_003985 [Malassezia vespertilionis]|uniref:uncharacterized protein n=1 Tax=Malassezia vespertilionis TaxID=2020962 RepID=UPI0024B0CF42|nr:uncharacterized protein MVES1_003985 [Malassezia vespertilionis]WFD08609.1 hypothetical protein MVES1_003985 [Malassezia vespertilionis]